MQDLKPQVIGNELYGGIPIAKADALTEMLDKRDMSLTEDILIDQQEKMILFEIMRASTELNIPGTTLKFEDFDRRFVMGKITWGAAKFVLKQEGENEKK